MRFAKPALALLAVLLIFGVFSHKAYAHFPATTGSLTAILHIEPDDYPPVNKPETLYLIFSDAANKFRLIDCTCSLIVDYGGNTLLSTTLVPPDTKDTVYGTKGVPFTFTQTGGYQIKLVGQPMTSASFQAFTLNWKINVSTSAVTVSTNDTTETSAASPEATPTPNDNSSFLKYFVSILGIMVLFGVIVFVAS